MLRSIIFWNAPKWALDPNVVANPWGAYKKYAAKLLLVLVLLLVVVVALPLDGVGQVFDEMQNAVLPIACGVHRG